MKLFTVAARITAVILAAGITMPLGGGTAHAASQNKPSDPDVVITEHFEAPLKQVDNSAAAITSLRGLTDEWIAKRDHFRYGHRNILFRDDRPAYPWLRSEDTPYELDCSAFVQAVLEGIQPRRSRYLDLHANPTADAATAPANTSDFGTTMNFEWRSADNWPYRRHTAGQLAQWAHHHGYWFATRQDLANLKVGDVVFWHRYVPDPANPTQPVPVPDAAKNPWKVDWKQISHIGFVTKVNGDTVEITDCTEVTATQHELISHRTLRKADLYRAGVYSAARFPLDRMWDWDKPGNEAAINHGWGSTAKDKVTYFNPTTGGKPTGNSWQRIDGRDYWFNALGDLVMGGCRVTIPRSAPIRTGDPAFDPYVTDYFTDDGRSVDHFCPIKDARGATHQYYVLAGPDADYQRGWKTIGGRHYYFDPASARMQTGWQLLPVPGTSATAWYYLRESGTRADGPQFIDREWYVFGDDGQLLRHGSPVRDGFRYSISCTDGGHHCPATRTKA